MGDRQRAIQVRALQAEVREVLLNEWDPISISDEPNAQDEYDSYVGPITQQLLSGGGDIPIVQQLHWIEVERMGLPSQSQAKLLHVAQALMQLLPDGR